MTLMHKMISVTATTMAMVSRRICSWLQSIIEKQISRVKVSWAIVGSGSRNMMQVLLQGNKKKYINLQRFSVYQKDLLSTLPQACCRVWAVNDVV